MALNTVTLTGNLTNLLQAGETASGTITPTYGPITNAAGQTIVADVPAGFPVPGGIFSLPGIIANDNPGLLPADQGYDVRIVTRTGTVLYDEVIVLNFEAGAEQDLSELTPAVVAAPVTTYMLQPSGTPAAGQVPVATGAGQASAWEDGGGGGGAVDSVFGRTGNVVAASGDYAVGQVTGAAPLASPALTGTPTAPTQTTGDSSTKIATDAFTAAAVAVETTRAETAEALKLAKASNLADLASAATARTNLFGSMPIPAADLPGPSDWQNIVTQGGADPTGTSDSTSVFTAAAATGGLWWVPKGTYLVSSAIAPGADTGFMGAGPNLSVLHMTSTTANVFDTSSQASVNRMRLENLGITGPGSGTGIGVKIATSGGAAATWLTLRNLLIYGMGGDGFQATDMIVSTVENVTAESCGGRGLAFLKNVFGCTSTSVLNSYGDSCTGTGIYVSGASHMAFHACPSDDNGGAAFDIEGCEAISFSGCGGYSPAGPQWKIGGASSAIALNACDANTTQNGQQAFWITGNSSAQLNSCNELDPSGTPVSLQIDSGSSCLALAFKTTTGNYVLNGTLTSIAANGSASITSTTAGLTVNGILVAAQIGSSLAAGSRISQGSGAPSKPNSVNPVAGDIWFRTDTSSTASQRIYICTTGGASPVWSGIV